MMEINNIKPDWEVNGVKVFKVDECGGDYKAVSFNKNNKRMLELRVSGTAVHSEKCGLDQKHIHEWLCKTGFEHINKVDKPSKCTIYDRDVDNGKLTTRWEDLCKDNI